MSQREESKKAAGYSAVDDLVKPGMKLGLGTGSTALFAVRRAAQGFQKGLYPGLLVVPTSLETLWECQALGLQVCDLNDPQIGAALDLYIDGADEFDPHLNAIKGGGAAHTLEKLVCSASSRFVIIADETKKVPHLGTRFPVPVEVLSQARVLVTRRLEAFGAQVKLRTGSGKQGPVITDNGHILLDLVFEQPIKNVKALEDSINQISGVIDCGLFPSMASLAYVGCNDGKVEILQPL